MTTIGIIGGTGLYTLEGLTSVRDIRVDTPFGSPSDVLVTGEFKGMKLIFVPRHGRGHRLLPGEVPYRANIFALKSLGVQWVISVSAVGSMREEIHPGDIVIPSQFVDCTRGRLSTFFGDGVAAHVSLADPVCSTLSSYLSRIVRSCGFNFHEQATYLCIEGPAFSTRAESAIYRQWGVDIIGMTAMPEAKLAREAELHYVTLSLVTDYDCWRQSETPVSANVVVDTLRQNSKNVRRILALAIPAMTSIVDKDKHSCSCESALTHAILTDKSALSEEKRAELSPIIKSQIRKL